MTVTVDTITLKKITKTVAAAATPEAIMSATDVDRFVSAFKVYVPTTNTGVVYIGDSTVDSSWDPIAIGTKEAFNAGEGSWGEDLEFDLSKIYVAVETDNDSVVIVYKSIAKSNV